MYINLERPFQSFFSQILPFMFSFLDDALLLLLSRLGLHLDWLQWLSPLLMSCMLTYWAVKLLRHLNCELIGKKQPIDRHVGSLIAVSQEAKQ